MKPRIVVEMIFAQRWQTFAPPEDPQYANRKSTTKERPMADAADIGTLKIEDFSPYLNTGFEVQLPDGKSVLATLAEAAANGTTPPAQGLKGREGQALKTRDGGGFTLQFVTPENAIRSQGIYSVKHPKLGTLEIFLVPNGPLGPKGGFGYHAVFG
jgi:hypothetical protein